MGLPPIIANNPVIKLFRSDPPKQKGDPAQSAPPGVPQDEVEISEAARKKFGEMQLRADRQARATSKETAALLGRDENLTLGLNPDFPA